MSWLEGFSISCLMEASEKVVCATRMEGYIRGGSRTRCIIPHRRKYKWNGVELAAPGVTENNISFHRLNRFPSLAPTPTHAHYYAAGPRRPYCVACHVVQEVETQLLQLRDKSPPDIALNTNKLVETAT